MTEQEGKLDAGGKSFAIIASRFNDFVVEHLIKGASDALLRMGAGEDAIELYRVPGAFEIPGVACKLVDGGGFDGIICLGAVIRGATPHFDYVAGESAREIARLAARSPVPVIYGVLTTDTVEQAIERAAPKMGNKGGDAAMAAVEMAGLYAELKRNQTPDA